jgi:hypothetical protein
MLTKTASELFQEKKSWRFLKLSENADYAAVLINEARRNLNDATGLLTGIQAKPVDIQPLYGQGELFPGNAVMYDKKLARICLGCLVETI